MISYCQKDVTQLVWRVGYTWRKKTKVMIHGKCFGNLSLLRTDCTLIFIILPYQWLSFTVPRNKRGSCTIPPTPHTRTRQQQVLLEILTVTGPWSWFCNWPDAFAPSAPNSTSLSHAPPSHPYKCHIFGTICCGIQLTYNSLHSLTLRLRIHHTN